MNQKFNKKAMKDAPPLTSETQLKATRKRINALNKQRSKQMEHKIAAYLRGRRVLMSGAAKQYKGDVEIPFVNYPGGYLIECKLSAVRQDNTPKIRMLFEWFEKIHGEAKAMNMKFGVVIIHFHGMKTDYVFVRSDIIHNLMYIYHTPYTPTLNQLAALPVKKDLRFNRKGETVLSFSLLSSEIESALVTIDNMSAAKYILRDGEYLLMPIQDYAALVEHI